MMLMFSYASSFNHFVGGWTEKDGLTTTFIFYGATAFLAKYASSSCGISAKPSECRAPLTDATFSSAITACLNESPTTGECTEYAISSGYGVMPYWDVSGVTDMSNAFESRSSFNADLSKWDVSSVENMNRMFFNAEDFNQVLSNWNVASVTDMYGMFDGSDRFQYRHLGVGRFASRNYGRDV